MPKSNRNKHNAKQVRFPEGSSDDNLHEEQNTDDVCHCVFGDNDSTAKRPWIQCTSCDMWQHNDCMNVSVFDDELEEHYWCQECAPDLHAALLASIGKGESPWKVRCARRLEMKAHFEKQIEAALERLEWLWEIYDPQPSVLADDDGGVPLGNSAPSHYVRAVKAGLGVLLGDLPMPALRDLARQIDASEGVRSVMKVLRKKAAAEYEESEVLALGVLSELFGWVEKGKVYSKRPLGADEPAAG